MKAMSNGGGGKAARAEKKEAKKDLKETRQMIKSVTPKGFNKTVKAVAKERMQATKSDKASKADKPISLKKTLKGIENAKPVKRISDKVKAPLNSGTKTASKSGFTNRLSELDKFSKNKK